jgi:hypothetical protein
MCSVLFPALHIVRDLSKSSISKIIVMKYPI